MTTDPALLALAFAGGFAAGLAYFALLWRAVRRLTGGGGWGAFALSAALRGGVLIAALAALAWSGAGAAALALAGLGFIAARLAATRALPRDREG